MLLRHADEFKSQTEQVQLCERDKCAMQWTQHGRSIEGSRRLIHAQPRLQLPPELLRRTHRSHFRVPQQHVRRALKVLLMASRRTWFLFPNTHKERTLRAPRKMMPHCHKQASVHRGRCAMHLAQLEPGPYTSRRSFHIARTAAKPATLCAACTCP